MGGMPTWRGTSNSKETRLDSTSHHHRRLFVGTRSTVLSSRRLQLSLCACYARTKTQNVNMPCTGVPFGNVSVSCSRTNGAFWLMLTQRGRRRNSPSRSACNSQVRTGTAYQQAFVVQYGFEIMVAVRSVAAERAWSMTISFLSQRAAAIPRETSSSCAKCATGGSRTRSCKSRGPFNAKPFSLIRAVFARIETVQERKRSGSGWPVLSRLALALTSAVRWLRSASIPNDRRAGGKMNGDDVTKVFVKIMEGDKYRGYRDQIESAIALGLPGRATLYEELREIVKGQEPETSYLSYLLSLLDTEDKRTFEEWRKDEHTLIQRGLRADRE